MNESINYSSKQKKTKKIPNSKAVNFVRETGFK